MFLARPHILMIDQSNAFRKSVFKTLRPLQTQVTEAASGRQAIDMISETGCDVILSNLGMPEFDGIDLCRRLKADAKTQSIPVVITSAFDSDQKRDQAFHAGAAACVSKNDGPARLLQVVEQMLSQSTFHRERLILVEKMLSDPFQLLFKEKERLDLERRIMISSITRLVQALEAR
jgi:CheY-like chemotaxis protein